MRTIGKIYAKNLQSLRGDRTQLEVAEAIGISMGTYQRMESSGSLPKSPETITAIAQYFKVPESRLFLDPDLAPQAPEVTPARALEVLAKAIEAPKIKIAEDPLVVEMLEAASGLDESQMRSMIQMIHARAGTLKSDPGTLSASRNVKKA